MKTPFIKQTFLRGVFFILLFSPALPNLTACDLSSFAQSSFSSRCQKIISLTEEAKLATALQTPDRANRVGALFNDWIDFYLAHNDSGIPPTMSFVSKDLWRKKLTSIGYLVREISDNKADNLEVEKVKIFFENLTVPDALKSYHDCAKISQEQFDQQIDFSNDKWITSVATTPLQKAQNLLQPGYEHTRILEKDIEDIKEEYARLKNYAKEFSIDELEPLISELKKNCSSCLSKWNSFFIFQ